MYIIKQLNQLRGRLINTLYYLVILSNTLYYSWLKGMCEMVMLGEDIPKQMKENGILQCYPGRDESDDEDLDALSESYDIQMGM